ncbi:unnamed protein product [Rotaria magnacalcarata]|uniref:Uncharacterized protein n=1 Tax=Rotaria magnacalcarata TaxID=392030 RepID=A0A816SCP8_9BILA|nr:unnamed protein product [Rotaria magnacalcarata]
MENEPTKFDLHDQNNTSVNQYPLVNQFDVTTDRSNINASYATELPSYSSCIQLPIADIGYVAPSVQYYEQIPSYSQQYVVVVVQTNTTLWRTKISTKITPDLRVFFIFSGVIYFILSLSTIGLEVTIILKSHWIVYRGIWASGFLLSGSISMFIIACRTSYSMIYLIRLLVAIFVSSLIGLILSAINSGISTGCPSIFSYENLCDKMLISSFKIIISMVFIVASIHSLIDLIVIGYVHKKTVLEQIVLTNSNH